MRSSRPTSSASSASRSAATGSAAAGTASTSSRSRTEDGPRPRRAGDRRPSRRRRSRRRSGCSGRERVTITGLQVVRRARPGQGPPARARLAPAPDLRDGLRGDDRPPAGRRRAPLPRVRASSVEVEVDPERLAKAREQIATAAAGMRARDYTPKPGLPRVHLLRVPRHLPGERRPLTPSSGSDVAPVASARLAPHPRSTSPTRRRRAPASDRGPIDDDRTRLSRVVRLIRRGPRRAGGPRLDGHGSARPTAQPGFFAAAAVVWLLVGLVVTTRDPVVDPSAGFIGAVLIGLAVALTLTPSSGWRSSAGTARSPTAATGPARSGAAAWVGVIVTVLGGAAAAGRARAGRSRCS